MREPLLPPDVRDAWRRDRWLWCGYGLSMLAYFSLRWAVLDSASGSQLVYPYFVSPSHPGFLLHVATGLRNYLENLCLVCESHHHLVHEGGWQMERLGGVTYTRRPNGTYRGLAPPGRSGGVAV